MDELPSGMSLANPYVEWGAQAKGWLEKAMIEGMDTVLNSTEEVCVPVEVEGRLARSWREGS